MAADLAPLPPSDAILALFARGQRLEPSFAWQDIWQDTHASMFTVAKSAGFDILSDIHAGLLQALAQGQTFRQFAAELTPLLQAKGWWGEEPALDPEDGQMKWAQLGSPRRLQTIFDVNMRVSYAAGHWASFERNKVGRPFLRYVCILDDRTRPAHRARHNLVLPVDHPYWNTWAPPCGWNCRCTLQQLSQRDVDRLQAQGEKLFFDPPADTFVQYTNSRTGEITSVPAGIDPGWAYNPGKAGFAEIERQAQSKMAAGLFATLERQWPPPPRNDAELLKLADDLTKGQENWERSLNRSQREAIETYKADGYTATNALLRDDDSYLADLDDDDIEVARLLSDDLSSAMKTARLPQSVTTFRGLPKHRALAYENLKPGDIVSDPAFFSSSLSKEVADKFGEFIIEARLQRGAPAIAFIHYIPDVNHVEYEVLLNAGYRMRVVEVRSDRLIVEVLAK